MQRPRRLRRAARIGLTIAMVAGAISCGTSSGSGSATGPTPVPSDPQAPVSSATTQPAATTPSTIPAGNGFCQHARVYVTQANTQAARPITGDLSRQKAAFAEGLEALQAASEVAPPELEGPLRALVALGTTYAQRASAAQTPADWEALIQDLNAQGGPAIVSAFNGILVRCQAVWAAGPNPSG